MSQYGTGVTEREVGNPVVRISGQNATISATVPEIKTHEYQRSEDVVHTNPSNLLKNGALPSFSLVRFALVKNFIDGVYATAEERVSEKGHKLSRPDFLQTLEKIVAGNARAYISAATQMQTHDDPSMTIPQGFYDWTEKLNGAYKQIKILAERPALFTGGLDDSRVIAELLETINNSDLRETYRGLIKLYSRMTAEPENRLALFPSAELPDQKFFKQLSFETQSDIPSGLGKALVEAVKRGAVNFVPDESSGLYVRQMYELLPLVLRDSEEFKKFLVNDKYAKILENEFISQWAGTRHTHAGHTSCGSRLIGSSMAYEQPPIIICPELPIEPLSTSYDRMLSSLGFLERTIKEHLPEVLDRKRLMNDGSRADIIIGEEFEDMILLLRGMGLISKDSIHLKYEDKDAKRAVARASAWIANAQDNPDIDRKTAIFVPIIRTTSGSRQVSYINAGFKTLDVDVSYLKEPKVEISPARRFEFGSETVQFPVLVHRRSE